jgi:hypothetical protein
MRTLTNERPAHATGVSINEDEIAVELLDGRTIIVPLIWYPRVLHGTAKERKNWRLNGQGEGIHWPDLDEDISVRNLLAGQPSGESQRSYKRWLESRLPEKPRKSRKN